MKKQLTVLNYNIFIPGFVAAGLLAGSVLYGFGYGKFGGFVWLFTLIVGALPLIYKIAKDLLRKKIGVDLIAIVAIFASILIQQHLAGIVILLMLSGGEALELFAQNRARRELTQLLSMAPVIAHVKQNDNELLDIDVNQVKIGNTFVIKPGEVIPVDGIVVSGASNLDESVITGESLPQEKQQGSMVYSGSINQEHVLEVRAIKESANSRYQTIVKLVKEAQETQAPIGRLADRYALFFNITTFTIAALTWFLFKDPTRVLAVLVVASPCPLILATPIAIISGISKAANRGIVIKNGTALETLAQVKTLIFDKTGTLTLGIPEVVESVSVSLLSSRQVLKIAASIDQLSSHIFARSLVQYAQRQSLKLDYPENFEELFGRGIHATIKNKKYFFGKLKYIAEQHITIDENIKKNHAVFQEEGRTAVYLGDDKSLLGYIMFSDIVRPETRDMFASIEKHNIPNIIMLTGDKESVAGNIARKVGITEYHAELLPEQKVEWIKKIQKKYGPAAMVGDGVNDAPAMAISAVGIAMAAHGATVASETGDVVVVVNNVHRVHDVLHITQRSMKIAKQGIWFGMGVGTLLMILALLGYIAPVPGAITQEVLDVVVIINALKITFEKVA